MTKWQNEIIIILIIYYVFLITRYLRVYLGTQLYYVILIMLPVMMTISEMTRISRKGKNRTKKKKLIFFTISTFSVKKMIRFQ